MKCNIKISSLSSPLQQLPSAYNIYLFDVEKTTAVVVYSYIIREDTQRKSLGKHQLFRVCHNYKNSLQNNGPQ